MARDLLRLTTAGSVDDGKSTLIGRLLHDTQSIPDDQLAALAGATRRRGEAGLNLALLTDGLRAEREQNITIDVAYRFFATPRRAFIVADTPGHLQYTRNMVTGASTADLAIVLVDARRGLLTQSRRHGYLAALLGIPHVIVAVNKMDLVGHDEAAFRAIEAAYRDFASTLGPQDVGFVPISALHGDNVVARSARMPWYGGATLLEALETRRVDGPRRAADFRLPVQVVIRPHQDFRGVAGRVAAGAVRVGDDVVVLPSRQRSRVRTLHAGETPLDAAVAGDSIVLTLEDELDVGRGDLLVRAGRLPAVARRVEAMLCWMAEAPLDPGVSYHLVHTTRTVPARVARVLHRVDVDTLRRHPAATLALNDIARVEIAAAEPLHFDPYAESRETGSFILVDPYSHATVAAGMLQAPRELPAPTPPPDDAAADDAAADDAAADGTSTVGSAIPRAAREQHAGHGAAVLWFTGLSGAGKSTLARALEWRLFERGCRTMLLDGDELRTGLCRDLGFTGADRQENVRRAGEVARLCCAQGAIVLCTFVSPYRADRDAVRALVPPGRFYEVHVDCGVDECARRDPKGLYARAARGELRQLTGVDAPYEAPVAPELVAHTETVRVPAILDALLRRLEDDGILWDTAP